MHETDPYLLQCVRLGMLIADPNELDTVEPWHFGDPVLRDIVSELKERRKVYADGGKATNGPTLLESYLRSLGCEDGHKSVDDAKSALRDRVEVDGMFAKAIGLLNDLARVNVELGSWSSYEKRRFAKAVLDGMNPK